MTKTISLINMKGGVGKSTLTFNLAWYSAWYAKLRVLAVDLDPQANLSQYFLGAEEYLALLTKPTTKTVVDIFEQFSTPSGPRVVDPKDAILKLHSWTDGSNLDLLPSRLELAWTLKNPTDKAQLLPQFLSKVSENYDLVLIDCAPTESILTNAAYRSSERIFVPVKPEFLATIGLPLIERSMREFKLIATDQEVEMGGVIFNDLRRTGTPPEQIKAQADVKTLAQLHGWKVFDNIAHHSDSYATGSRDGKPIFMTDYARTYVKGEFSMVAKEFLKAVGLE